MLEEALGDQSWVVVLPFLIPIVGMLLPALIIALVFYFVHRGRREVQRTIRAAIEKGQDLPTEFLENINRPKAQPRKDQDLRRGIILTAVGLGIGAFGFLVGEEDAIGPFMGIGSIPLLIGIGLTILWVVRSRHEN